MSKTIDTERYCWALETWAALSRDDQEAGRDTTRVREVCAHLRETMPGVRPIKALCEAFRARVDDDHEAQCLLRDIAKSCLLYRLIYAGEELRTTPCPKHKGRWSGWSFDPCACSFGPNLTGWLP
jgi:hypothetical protein